MKNLIGGEIKLTADTWGLSIVSKIAGGDTFLVLESVNEQDDTLRTNFTARLTSVVRGDSTVALIKSGNIPDSDVASDAVDCRSRTWVINKQQADTLRAQIMAEEQRADAGEIVLNDASSSSTAPPLTSLSWAQSMLEPLNLPTSEWVNCTPYLPLTMGQALVLWLKISRIIEQHGDKISNVEQFIQIFSNFEQALYENTQAFLETEFAKLNQDIPHQRRYIESAAFSQYLQALAAAGQIPPQTTVIAPRTDGADNFLSFYTQNIQTAKRRFKAEIRRGQRASLFAQIGENQTDQRIDEIEDNYLKSNFMNRQAPVLNQLIKAVPELAKISQLYNTFHELVEICETSKKMVFSINEVKQVSTALLVYQKTLQGNDAASFNDAVANVFMHLMQLKPFFSFNGNDFYALAFGDTNIPSLLIKKVQANDFTPAFSAVARVIMYFDVVDKHLRQMIANRTDGIDQNLLTAIHTKLTYQMSRNNRLCLMMNAIGDELKKLNDLQLLSSDEIAQLDNFKNAVLDRLRELNHIINGCQSAIKYQSQIRKLLAQMNTVNPANSTKIRMKKAASHRTILFEIKKIIDDTVNSSKSDLKPDAIAYGEIADKIREKLFPPPQATDNSNGTSQSPSKSLSRDPNSFFSDHPASSSTSSAAELATNNSTPRVPSILKFLETDILAYYERMAGRTPPTPAIAAAAQTQTSTAPVSISSSSSSIPVHEEEKDHDDEADESRLPLLRRR